MAIIDTNNNVSGHLSVLKALGVTAIGRYYASSQRKRVTRIEASAISAAGLDLFVVFENSGDPQLSFESGVHDAQIALGQAEALGQPEGTAIYFALEHDKFGGFGTDHIPGLKRYLDGVKHVLGPQYKVGVYGDGVVCKTALDAGLCDFTWLSASTKHPGTPEFTASGRATLIQGKRSPNDRGGAIDKTIDGLSIDFNIALKPDFGQFRLTAEKPAIAAKAPPTSFAETSVPMDTGTGPAPASPVPVLPGGWVFVVQRLREELRPGKRFRRTVGTYQVYRNGKPVSGLSGTTVERQGPGDNGATGKRQHRCIEAATYALFTHDTDNYSTVDYETNGDHPRPAIEVGGTGRRIGILIHPASGYGSTIGCVNLSDHLANANSDFSLADSTHRVIAVIEDLKDFNGGTLPSSEGVTLANCHLVVRDAATAHVAIAAEAMAEPAFEIPAPTLQATAAPRAEIHAGSDGITSDDAALLSALDELKAAARQLTAGIERIAEAMGSGAPAARTAGADVGAVSFAADETKPAAPALPVPTETLTGIAANSNIARHDWRNRGRAPLGYIKGMAVTYAELYSRLKANDPIVAAMAAPIDPNSRSDALAWYTARLKSAGMGDNDTPFKRLRHLFVLLTGLGMRESSGRYCEGRDSSAHNTSSDTAEAGLFQISFNLIDNNRDLNAIFDRYLHNPDGHVDIFKEGVTCKARDLQNSGSPNERGFQFQELTKKCPAFAVELAARGLRLNKNHWGPLVRREAEVVPSCEDLFVAIEEAIDSASPVHAEAMSFEAETPAMAAAAPQPVPATGGINLTSSQRLLCERIISVFETGSIRGDYSNISIYHDGPNRIRQITYGRAQTTEYSHLRELVQMYVDASGKYSEDLRPYVPRIGRTALVDNDTFKSLLRRAGREDPVMVQTQDVFFDRAYFQPALKWANEHGFTHALSMLVIYDSFIHSGGILDFLRARFREQPPVNGGDEKVWISEYVQARNDWLATNSNEVLRPTVYRTQCLAHEIARGNWDLSQLPITAHGVRVDDKAPAISSPFAMTAARAPEPVEEVPYLGPDGGAEVFGEESAEIWGDDHFAESHDFAAAAAGESPMNAAAIAEEILSSPRIKLATSHVSGVVDEANAHQTMEDTAGGHAAHRSSYGGAPGGTVALNLSMLRGLIALAERYSFAVSELCGGSHNPNSRHYAGVAFDVNEINGKPVRAGHPDLVAFKALCRKLGATEVLGPGQPNHATHVHAGWPRPKAHMAMIEDSEQEASNARRFPLEARI